ncbi:MAG: hypothetical protein KGP28_00025 [Bdellovibrionales bacterium]|nr:hypothetical protein [Bdellovibrionales bacterium]
MGIQEKPGSCALTLDATPDSFFFELVRNAVERQKVRLQPETEFYVVKLLKRFIFSDALYSKSSDGSLQEQPIAFLYKEALEAEAHPEQKVLFQNVGDISLFKAGFFSESLSRANLDINYYIGLGGSAYLNAAQRSDEKHFRSLFSELGDQFGKCVNILSEVSEATTPTRTEQDLLRLYDIWSNTGSERVARTLSKTGIRVDNLPNPGSSRKKQ